MLKLRHQCRRSTVNPCAGERHVAVAIGAVIACVLISTTVRAGGRDGRVFRVPSSDGTPIAVEREGSGPTLLIVHGGLGDRTRWTPLFPLLSSHFTVCAMDRRGASGDSPTTASGRRPRRLRTSC